MADVLVDGPGASGRARVLSAPISFWGGIDARSGRITDVRHPDCGAVVAGRVLFVPGTIGSSSASAVLLELVRNGQAPAALVLHEADAILLIGLIVAREMGWPSPIALRMDRGRFQPFQGRPLRVGADGSLALDDNSRIGCTRRVATADSCVRIGIDPKSDPTFRSDASN
jgi:predicted aconitase with swiveling domain